MKLQGAERKSVREYRTHIILYYHKTNHGKLVNQMQGKLIKSSFTEIILRNMDFEVYILD